jgi:hypothetical protein
MLKKLIIIISIGLLILIAGCSNKSYKEVQGETSYNHSSNQEPVKNNSSLNFTLHINSSDINDITLNYTLDNNISRIASKSNKTNLIHATLPKCIAGCGKGYDYNKTDCKRYCYELDDYCFCNKTGLRG